MEEQAVEMMDKIKNNASMTVKRAFIMNTPIVVVFIYITSDPKAFDRVLAWIP
ncbi:hypothetical protein D3C75_1300350 [compost metagenome]